MKLNKKAFSIGLFIGGTIGAVTSLLSAPSSGKKLREELKNSTNEWIEILSELKTNANELKDSLTNLSIEGKEIVRDLSSDIKTTVEQWRNNIEPNKRQLQSELREIQQTLEDLEQKFHNESANQK